MEKAISKKNTQNNHLIIFIMFIMVMLCAIFFNLPEFILDVLIGFNITFALMIMFTSMSSKEALDFDAFPSLLLFTTLFRVCLNIATTKSILSNGSAGKLIEAFGQILIGGNAVIGVIVFLIICIVNLIVIAKGSERVSEIAARFTLDALPGKQVSIESELNQGLITEEEAKIKKQKIQREADFIGAMDGATKFVKGDSVASLIITTINIIAGSSFGIFRDNLSFAESLSSYTVLTVGDGLLSSIPALLISVSTGIMVTRPFSENDIGIEIISQVFRNPFILYLSGTICLLFGFVPGVNFLLFFIMGASFILVGYKLEKSKEKEDTQDIRENNNLSEIEPIEENYFEYYNQEILELEIGMGLVSLARKSQGGQLEDKLELIRRQLLRELGFLTPDVRIRDNVNLPPYEYCININGLKVDSYTLNIDKFLAIPSNEDSSIDGVETKEPTYNFDAIWIDESKLKEARKKDYHIADCLTVMATHFTSILKKYAYEMLTRENVKQMLDIVKEKNPTIVEELIPSVLTLGQVQKVLSNLLRENVPIKNLALILEALADNATMTKDTSLLTEMVRERLKKQIISTIKDDDIYYISFTANSEKILSESLQENHLYGLFLAIHPQKANMLLKQLKEYSNDILSLGKSPILVCSSSIRFYLNRFIEQSQISFVKVLSYDEISVANSAIYNRGVINIED